MDSSLILANILSSPVLFFFMGMIAIFLKSDLDIPQPLPKLFSLCLLFVMGFKGGHKIYESGINGEITITLLAAIVLAAVVTIYYFFMLKTKLDAYNAAAIIASYGSISAVTFITASCFLEQQTPPIEDGGHFFWSEVLRAAFLNASVFLFLGSLLVEMATSQKDGTGYTYLQGTYSMGC